MKKISKLLGLGKRGEKKRSKDSELSEVNIQVEGHKSSIGSSSRPTFLPSSPNTSLLVPASPGSDQKHESSSQSSGSFFQNPDGVSVSGGNFSNVAGHNITISFPRSEGSTVQRPGKIIVADPPAESSPGNSAGESASRESTAGISISIGDSPKPDVEMVTHKGNEIYERHLLLKGRGFPLWIPEPNNRLQLAYRRRGIHIGDVGIITPSGGFSYLFNICVARGHPLNPRALPEDFAPLDPPLDPVDTREFSEFKAGSHLASASIEHSQSELNTPGLVFETSAKEGAVLTMPEGAVALDLENIPLFREYVAVNVEKWYKFVNGVRGREAKNGDVRLVIGCDKATSWGIAAISNVTQQKASQLKFKILEEPNAKSLTTSYTWEYSGMAEVRVGPDAKEINALRNGEADSFDSNHPSEAEFSNQCLFVRTLNATLSDKAWKELNDSLGSPSVLDSSPFSRTTFLQTPSRPRGRTFSTTIDTQQTSPDTPTSGSQRPLHPLHSIGNEHDEERLRFSTTPDFDVQIHHPSDGLNGLLLKKFPNVGMVVTLDRDWCSGIKEGERDLPDPQQLLERLMSSHDVRMEDGILFLERKEIQEREIPESSEEPEDVDTWKTTAGAPSPDQQRIFSQPQETRTSCSNCQKMKFKCLLHSVEDEKRCQQCVDRNLKCELSIGKGPRFRVSPKQVRLDLAAKEEEEPEEASLLPSNYYTS